MSDLLLLKAMITVAKVTIFFQAGLLFYFFGNEGKVPASSRNIFFVIANGGCLFLAGGLTANNNFLITSGAHILIIHALVDFHTLLSRYQLNKKTIEEDKKKNAKK